MPMEQSLGDDLCQCFYMLCQSAATCHFNWGIVIAGFNVETVEYKNISFTVWDVGGQDKVQPFLSVFMQKIIFLLHCIKSLSFTFWDVDTVLLHS